MPRRWQTTGTDFRCRNDVLRERLEAMRAIWTQTKPEYHGDFVEFGPMMTWPKPVQKPHPPVLVGGGMPYGARRALAFGDGWMPHARRPTYHLLEKLPQFHDMAGTTPAAPCPLRPLAWSMIRPGGPPIADAGIARIVLQPGELGRERPPLAAARITGRARIADVA